ncbi:MAG TPA: lysophospholipid acyltransferase family protein [Polyangiaceae bacterium]|nr:lysophospholipid acyltransferase family protein [Polyangiaceae bacterium]
MADSRPMKEAALGLYSYLEFGACVAAFLPVMGLVWARHRADPTQRVPGQWMRRLGRTTSALTPLWKFHVEGEAPADVDARPYVVVANHESLADPFLLSWLPWDMRWVAKRELFEIPLIGLVFKFSGDIPLVRGESGSIKSTMAACRESLDNGMSIMMFPEGTRSKNGQLLSFKDGAFRLAIEAGVPILPVAIVGTKDCLQKGSKRLGMANAVARVLPVISTEGATLDDVASIRERARASIQAAVDEMRASAPASAR